MGIFLQGEDSRGDHGLGRLVEFRLKAPPGTTSSSITTHTSSGQRNCALWASQTLEVGYTCAMPRREDHEVHKRTCGGVGPKKKTFLLLLYLRLSLGAGGPNSDNTVTFIAYVLYSLVEASPLCM